MLVLGWAGGGKGLGELFGAEGGEDGHDVGVVGEVEVEGLVEGEGGVHLVEGCVDVGGARGEVVEVIGEAGVEFFDVADADAAAAGGGEAVVAVELEVDGIFEALPFGVGEEIAPFAVAKGDGFVGAHGLGLEECQIVMQSE